MSKHKSFLVQFFLSFILVFSVFAQEQNLVFSSSANFENLKSKNQNFLKSENLTQKFESSTQNFLISENQFEKYSTQSQNNSFFNSIFTKDKSSPFYLDLTMDTFLLSFGLGFYATNILLDDVLKINQVAYNGETYLRSDVNSFDRIFMNPYSKSMDLVGSVVCGLSLALPLVNLATESSEWIKIGTMYAETLLFALGIKDIIKLCENRARPYMYFEGFPQKDVDSGDWNNSFPSGHTTMAAAGASFASFVFSQYFDGWAKWTVIGGSSALVAGTAVCRILSGNHFLSDVIVGAIIGSSCGILVPLLHKNFDFNKDLGNAKLSFNATNLNVRFEL